MTKLAVSACVAALALAAFVSCEGPVGPAGTAGANGAAGVDGTDGGTGFPGPAAPVGLAASGTEVANVDFNGMVKADIVGGGVWSGGAAMTYDIVAEGVGGTNALKVTSKTNAGAISTSRAYFWANGSLGTNNTWNDVALDAPAIITSGGGLLRVTAKVKITGLKSGQDVLVQFKPRVLDASKGTPENVDIWKYAPVRYTADTADFATLDTIIPVGAVTAGFDVLDRVTMSLDISAGKAAVDDEVVVIVDDIVIEVK